MPRAGVVLICADEPLLAALLGMLAELAEYTPAFPQPGERPEDALARVRPLLVVLLDGALDSAQSDLFFAQAARRRVGLAIFGAGEQAARAAAYAQSRGVAWLDVTSGIAGFRHALTAAATSQWWQERGERREARRRQPTPSTEHTADGTLVFLDRQGERWLVYDRRGSDRRRADRRTEGRTESAEPDRRLFVNESGETWECTLRGTELEQRTPPALEGQLARATRV